MPPPPFFAAFGQLNLVDGLNCFLVGGVFRVGHIARGFAEANQIGISQLSESACGIPPHRIVMSRPYGWLEAYARFAIFEAR